MTTAADNRKQVLAQLQRETAVVREQLRVLEEQLDASASMPAGPDDPSSQLIEVNAALVTSALKAQAEAQAAVAALRLALQSPPIDAPVGLAGETMTPQTARDLLMRDTNERLLLNSLQQTDFMAMVAHEFRNPLAAINNAAAALQHPNATAATTARIGPLLARQVTQLSRLAGDLMSATSGNSDRFRLEWHCFDLALLIESAVEGCRPGLENKRQTLVNAVADGPWLVKGDPVRIAQVLRNLLDNACKYTPDGGHISIGLASRGTMIEVTIADDGIGIAPNALDSVFGLFAQEDKTHGRQVGGLGIGLAVAKQLIEAHGGHIAATSAGLGRGSQFVFSLQRAE